MEVNKRKNPWIGLESYKEGEVLYGRNDDIRDLTQSVLSEKDLLFYGKSGIGKSSILNAGVIPAARRHGYLPIPIRFSHKGLDTYLQQISEAIASQMIPTPIDEDRNIIGTNGQISDRENQLKERIREVVACKDKESESLYEYFHRHTFHSANGERVKLLIIFDQFEEIFTLQSNEKKKKQFFSELADLLNDTMPTALQKSIEEQSFNNEEVNIGNANSLDDIFDSFKLNLDIDTQEYVLDNDIHFVFTIREDFLSEFEYYSSSIPSLKHNRYGLRPLNEEQASQIILSPLPGLVSKDVAKLIIEKVSGRTDFQLDGIPEIEVDAAVLSLYLSRLYDAKQEDKLTAELVSEKGGEIISDFYIGAISDVSESTIEYLEDNLLNGQGRRDNVSIYDAMHEGGVTEEELDILCDKKKILRQFNYAGDLRIEFVHDILCPVIRAHKEERLQLKERQEILKQEKLQREEIERKVTAERKRNRRRLAIAFGSIIVVLGIILAVYVLRFMPYSVDYGSYTTINGWPVGVGNKVSEKSVKEKLIVYYRLTREGLLPEGGFLKGQPFSKVEVLNSNGEKTTNVFIETPVVRTLDAEFNDYNAKCFANLLKKTAYWIYTPSNSAYNEVSKCTAYDSKGIVLYSIQYYRDMTCTSTDTKYVQWAVFNDANGKQMMVTDNGIDRMRQTVSDGVVNGCLFFTEIGTPQKNAYETYGYQYEIDSETHLITKQYKVDRYGNPDKTSSVEYTRYDKYGRITKTSSYVIEYKKGMQIYRFKNFNDTLLFNDKGMLTFGVFRPIDMGYGKIAYEYDDSGRPIKNEKFNTKGALVESRKYTYLVDSNDYSQISYYSTGLSYDEKYEYPDSNTIVVSLWTSDGKKFTKKDIEWPEKGILPLEDLGIIDKTYHTKSIKKYIGEYLTKTTEYKDISGEIIARTIANYVINNGVESNTIKTCYIYGEKGEILTSEWFEYDEYGNRIAHAVAGIDGTPVRCPKWDWDEVCYYKMAVIYPFNDKLQKNMVSATGFNEFGDTCYIQMGNDCLSINETPYNYDITKRIDYETVMSIAKTEVFEGDANSALFIHILSKDGTLYSAKSLSKSQDGLKDGDILVRVGSRDVYPKNNSSMENSILQDLRLGAEVIIARVNIATNKYDIKKFKVSSGNPRAEIHYMNLTKEENKRLLNSISK